MTPPSALVARPCSALEVGMVAVGVMVVGLERATSLQLVVVMECVLEAGLQLGRLEGTCP